MTLEKQGMGISSKTEFKPFFLKLNHGDLVLFSVTLTGTIHAPMEFQWSGAYEKQDTVFTTKYAVHFRKNRSQRPSFV